MISGIGDARIVSISLRVYSLLLASYPKSFRQQYAAHMLQAFGDYTRRVYLQRGLPGMLWWWTLTLFDYLNSVVEEHLQRITYMTKEKFIRLGGYSFIIAGLLTFIFQAGESIRSIGRSSVYNSVALIWWFSLSFFLAIGLFALRSRYQEKVGALSNVALLFGGILGSISAARILFIPILFPRDNGDLDFLFMLIGILSSLLALFVFGVDIARKKILPNLYPLLLLLALPLMYYVLMISQGGSSPSPNASLILVLLIGIVATYTGYMLLSGANTESVETAG